LFNAFFNCGVKMCFDAHVNYYGYLVDNLLHCLSIKISVVLRLCIYLIHYAIFYKLKLIYIEFLVLLL